MTEKVLLTITEACARFSIGRTQVYEHIKHGRLNKVQPMFVRRTLLRLTELEALFGDAAPGPDPQPAQIQPQPLSNTGSVEAANSPCPACGASRNQHAR